MSGLAENSEDMAATAAPISRDQRIISLDLMRGIAVLGILLANITAFAHVDLAYYWPPALPGGAVESDKLVWLAQFVLVDGKLRGLFTILFGAGMVLFVDRIEHFDRAVVLQGRRLFWLALFGLAHFYLLFIGDILFSYACAGVVGLMLLRLKANTMLRVGIIWSLIAAALGMLDYLTPTLIEAGGDVPGDATATLALYREFWDTQLAAAAMQDQLVSSGSFFDIMRDRYVNESGMLVSYFALGFFETIPLMLIGMGFYRSGVFNPGDGKPAWRGLAIGALTLGLAMNLACGLYVYLDGFQPYTTQFAFFGVSALANLPMLVGGTYLLAKWAAQPRDSWLAERLTAAGRMAFSNYIGTSLVMVLIFQGWAGGLFGTMHRLELLLVVALGWALMLGWSRPWLARYRYGPLEYLWRCLTYWRLFPMKR